MSIPPLVFPPNDSIPLVVGYDYQLGTSDVWVRITSVADGVVRARGIGNTIADIEEPSWRFDDLIGAYKIN